MRVSGRISGVVLLSGVTGVVSGVGMGVIMSSGVLSGVGSMIVLGVTIVLSGVFVLSGVGFDMPMSVQEVRSMEKAIIEMIVKMLFFILKLL